MTLRPRAEWVERLAAHDVPAADVNDIPEAMADPEIVHSGMFRPHADEAHGRLTLMRRAVRIDGEREARSLPPPLLGEHSEGALRAAGFSGGEIAALREQGVV
jgi:formyl-CoA transferase